MRHMLKFDKCETIRCVNVTVNNDVTLEQEESFFIIADSYDFLGHFSYIFIFLYEPLEGEMKIMDDKDECKNLYNTN